MSPENYSLGIDFALSRTYFNVRFLKPLQTWLKEIELTKYVGK